MRLRLSVVFLVILSAAPLAARDQTGTVQNLKTLSLEELMQIDVTTVSREPERRAGGSVLLRQDGPHTSRLASRGASQIWVEPSTS